MTNRQRTTNRTQKFGTRRISNVKYRIIPSLRLPILGNAIFVRPLKLSTNRNTSLVLFGSIKPRLYTLRNRAIRINLQRAMIIRRVNILHI